MNITIRRKISHLRVANPHWPILFLAAALWAYYLYLQINMTMGHPMDHHSMGHHSMDNHSMMHHGMIEVPTTLWNVVFDWIIMVYAMMLPMTSSTIRSLRSSVPLYRYKRSVFVFIVGYTLIWLVFGLLIQAITPLISHYQLSQYTHNIPVSAVAFLIAGFISNSQFRMTTLNACGSLWAPRIRGIKADWDILTIGIVEGKKCVRTCAHIMIAMQLSSHSILIMAVFTLALCYEKHRYKNKKNVLRNICYFIALSQLILFFNEKGLLL